MSTPTLLFFRTHTGCLITFLRSAHTIRNRFLRRIHVRTHVCFVTRADDDQCNVAVTPFSAVMILVTRSHEVDYITERLSTSAAVYLVMAPDRCSTYLFAWIHDDQVDAAFVANDPNFHFDITSLYQCIHLAVYVSASSMSKRFHRHSGLRSTSVQSRHHP